MTEPWWEDPRWQLVEYDATYWNLRGEPAPEKPAPGSERAQPPDWASLYHRSRPVATWYLRPIVRDVASNEPSV